jgi:hypothetical protein
MPPIPLPADEAGRIASLRDLALLDTPPDLDFDVFPALAARFFATPIAAVSLVDSDRVWFKASHGLDAKEVSRGVSPCAHAILQPDALMIVPDAQEDLRFHDNPLVTGAPGIRFYASARSSGPAATPWARCASWTASAARSPTTRCSTCATSPVAPPPPCAGTAPPPASAPIPRPTRSPAPARPSASKRRSSAASMIGA